MMKETIQIDSRTGMTIIVFVAHITHIEPNEDGAIIYLANGQGIDTSMSPEDILHLAKQP